MQDEQVDGLTGKLIAFPAPYIFLGVSEKTQ
jgi:hypothetical protein